MALESICGFNKLPFMRGNVNLAYAQIDANMSGNIMRSPYSIMAMPLRKAAKNLNRILAKDKNKWNLSHGTTTLGFKYQGGIVMCADSRATMGDFVISERAHKIVELDKCMLGTIAGCAGDCYHWHRVLTRECRLYRINNHNNSMPVSSAIKFLFNVMNAFANMDLDMGIILAGYESVGPKLFYLDNEDDYIEGNMFAVGSGDAYALAVLDDGYRWDMSDEAAFALARRAVNVAINKDPYSGGLIRLYHMTAEGWKIISMDDAATHKIQAEYEMSND